MNQSEQINELAIALVKAQMEMKPAIKGSNNPFFKSKYADLKSIFEACQEALNKYGIAILQPGDIVNGKTVIRTTLLHISGQWISSVLPVVTVKEDSQSMGSAVSYTRRYGLASMVGIVAGDEDDDGNAATRPAQKPATKGNADSKEKSEAISYFQANELNGLLSKCSSQYQANFWKFLKTQVQGIEKLGDLPRDMYLAVRNGMERNIGDSEEKYA